MGSNKSKQANSNANFNSNDAFDIPPQLPSTNLNRRNLSRNSNLCEEAELDIQQIPSYLNNNNNSYGSNFNYDDDFQNDIISTLSGNSSFKIFNPSRNPFKSLQEEPLLSQTTQVSETQTDNISDLNEIINLTLKYKRNTVQLSSKNSLTAPMLASIKVKSQQFSKKSPVDLVCVIDHSGSMEGEKIKLVIKTFEYLLDQLDENDRLSIILFDDQVHVLNPLVRVSESNKTKILSAVQVIYANGGTNINLGVCAALDLLKNRKEVNSVTSIFLLSDGLDGGAQQKVKNSIDTYNLAENFSLHTFGFGSDHDPKLMTDIANIKDGNFYYIEKLDTIDETFVSCLGGLASVVAKDLVLKIKAHKSELFPQCSVAKAYGDDSMWKVDNGVYITKLLQVCGGVEKNFVLEINLPATSKQLKDNERKTVIAEAELSFVGIDGKRFNKNANLEVQIIGEKEEIPKEEDDKEVMKNLYRVLGADRLKAARGAADANNFQEAQKILNSFKSELAECVVQKEEFIQNLALDVEDAIRDTKNKNDYEKKGRILMMENEKCQYQMKENLKSHNLYSNEVQVSYVQKVKSKKAALF